jgi:hypothetical protein
MVTNTSLRTPGCRRHCEAGARKPVVEPKDMTERPQVQSASVWRLGRLEIIALAIGAGIGLMAAAPLLWLSSEAQRTGHSDLGAAATLSPAQLLLVWLIGTVVGGWLAAGLVRRMLGAADVRGGLARHLVQLAVGVILIVLLSPLPLALAAVVGSRQPHVFHLYYISSGGLVGWQPGVISFVFLYTFRVLEQRRTL